jgi:hypothetical protein
MKFRSIVVLFLFTSCSANWHIKKAIKKDPTIQKTLEYVDTLRLKKTVIDTIHTSDSTYYIQVKEMSYDTVVKFVYQKYDFSELKSWYQIKQEEKTKRVQIRNERKENKTKIKQEGKTDRTKIRQENKTERGGSWWWLWLAIGLLVGFFVRAFIKAMDIMKM